MSYVSLWRKIKDRITKASLANRDEIIGLLVGQLENDTLIIEDTVTGAFSGEPHRVVLLPQTIAKIADDIVKGKLKGNIVGWYHSHTEGGIFFSETDVATQLTLQQFSPLVVGMVVDAHTGDVGIFRVADDKKPVRISEEKVTVFSNRSEATHTSRIPSQENHPKTIQVRSKSIQKLIIATVLIVLIASLGIAGLLTHAPPTASIRHVPITNTIVGSPIMITANSTGIKNMTLFYAGVNVPLTAAEMTATSSGQYQFTIPASQVTGNLTYYLEAMTDSGGRISTNVFHIQASDFSISAVQSIIAYRNSTKPTALNLSILPINGFDRAVTVSAPDVPKGVEISFIHSYGPPGTDFSANVVARSNAVLGTFLITVTAILASESQQVVRTSAITLTITDFGIEVSPSTLSVATGSGGDLSLKINIQPGWGESPVVLSFSGLPLGAEVQENLMNGTLLMTGSGTIMLVIRTAGVIKGVYSITVTATGLLSVGGVVVHSQTIQLTVR